MRQKEYENYDSYLTHQSGKTKKIIKSKQGRSALSDWDNYFERALGESISSYQFLRTGASVICLGARQGGEVKSFINKGCFAIGVDLFPTPGNKYVVYGDFNKLQFANSSVEVVFTNSLDHAYDIKALVKEIHRVLCIGGHFIVDVTPERDQDHKDPWACCWWTRHKEIIDLFCDNGFLLISKLQLLNHFVFDTQFCFRKENV